MVVYAVVVKVESEEKVVRTVTRTCTFALFPHVAHRTLSPSPLLVQSILLGWVTVSHGPKTNSAHCTCDRELRERLEAEINRE